MNKDELTKISVTLEISSYELEWLSKLFSMMDDAKIFASQNGSLAGKKINEIKGIIDTYQLERNEKKQGAMRIPR